MFDFVPVLTLTAIVFVVINFLKYITAGDWRAAVTQLIVWAAGIVGVVLFAHSDWGTAITLGDKTLDQLNGWSQVIAGFAIGSLASAGTELKKAFDNSDSAAKPPLIK